MPRVKTSCDLFQNMNFRKAKYFLTTTLAGFFLSCFFCYSTLAAQDSISFVAVGDTGHDVERQKAVADQMAVLAEKENISFVILLGDNLGNYGVRSIDDSLWETKFEDVYHHTSLEIPFYAILGNHAYWGKGKPDAQIEYTKKSERWTMPAKYYKFTHQINSSTSVDFFSLNTSSILWWDSPEQIAWLKNELSNSHAKWKIVLGHHPLYSHGRYGGFDKIKKILEPLFIQYGIDLYLCGHDHHMELITHPSGVNYLIAGAGSAPRIATKGENTVFAKSELGFVWLNITEEEIDIKLVDEKGNVIFDYAIKKNA